MKYEKTLLLETGRSVKVISQPANSTDPGQLEIEILIKEPKETHYHSPIGRSHPRYWRMQKMDREKSARMQIEYSGLSDKQIRKVMREIKSELLK